LRCLRCACRFASFVVPCVENRRCDSCDGRLCATPRLALPRLRARQRTDEHDMPVQALAEDGGHMLNRDDIIRMARESGLYDVAHPHPAGNNEAVERFAALAYAAGAAAEREACAKVCDEWVTANHVYVNGAIRCGLAIRARGQA
jgi:hypothetical protein